MDVMEMVHYFVDKSIFVFMATVSCPACIFICRGRAAGVNIIQGDSALKNSEEERFSDQFGRSMRALSDYLGMGVQIAVGFAFFVFLGYWADGRFGTSPFLLLFGVMAGLAGMVLVLMKVTRQANKK